MDGGNNETTSAVCSYYSLTPGDVDEARRLLESICFRYNSNIERIDANRVLQILKLYPELASEHFGYNRHFSAIKPRRPILAYLVRNNVVFDIVREIYELNPDSIPISDELVGGETLLHVACKSECSEEIIQFIANKSPKARSRQNRETFVPLQCLMKKRRQRRAALATIKSLLPIIRREAEVTPPYPLDIAVAEVTPPGPLEMAVCYGYEVAAMELIVEEFHVINSLKIRFTESGWRMPVPLTLSSELVYYIEKLLLHPKLKYFYCLIEEWTEPGFVALMNALQTNRTLDVVEIVLPERLSEHALIVLGKYVSSFIVWDHLVLSAKGHGDTNGGILNTIARGFQEYNGIVPCIHLDGFNIADARIFCDLIAWGPESLKISYTNIRSTQWPYGSGNNIQFARMGELAIIDCFMARGCWMQFLDMLLDMPVLRKLEIDDSRFSDCYSAWNKLDVSEPFVNLLVKNVIEELRITGRNDFDIDFETLCSCLRQNTALKIFHVEKVLDARHKKALLLKLLEDNTTIQDCVTKYEANCEYTEVLYWQKLNLYGRKQARNLNTSKAEFVSLLQAAAQPRDTFEILYGLLRECPAVWCHCEKIIGRISGRKRKPIEQKEQE